MNSFFVQMKLYMRSLSYLACFMSIAGTLSAEDEIKLSTRKDSVISAVSRAQVLDAARQQLSEKGEAFLSRIDSVESPFAFEKAEQTVVAHNNTQQVQVETVQEPIVNYDDASVLKVVASNFSKQVRGTLARGDTSFLQLKGGNMVKPGTSFPVSIPQAKDKTFNITITQVTGDSYTLRLGDVEQTVRLDAISSTGTGAQRVD